MSVINTGDGFKILIWESFWFRLAVFDIQELSSSSSLSEDAGVTCEVCRKYDRQLVEEGDKGLIDGLWKRRRVAPCWHQTGLGCLFSWSSNSICLSWGGGVCGTLPFVSSIDGAPQWWQAVRCLRVAASWRQIILLCIWRYRKHQIWTLGVQNFIYFFTVDDGESRILFPPIP